jgi:hypothetical protein
MLRKNMSPPSSGSKNKPSKKEMWKRVSCLPYSSTMKMETTCFSEMSVDFYCTTRLYILEDRTLWIQLTQDNIDLRSHKIRDFLNRQIKSHLFKINLITLTEVVFACFLLFWANIMWPSLQYTSKGKAARTQIASDLFPVDPHRTYK